MLLCAQDRQIHIHDELCVAIGDADSVARRQDVGDNTFDTREGEALCGQVIARPVGAARFVVASARGVNGIVEPQRDFDDGPILGERCGRIELDEASLDVRGRVVVSVPLAVGGAERVESVRITLQAEGGVQTLPAGAR